MGDESGQTTCGSSRIKKWLKDAPFFCKVIELLLCVISMGLIVDPFNDKMLSDFNHVGLVYIAIGGYILINAILIICYLYGEHVGPKTALMFTRLGAILCIAAGIVLIYDCKKNVRNNSIPPQYEYQYLKQMLASGIFAILAGIVFAVEMFLVSRKE